MKIAIVGPGGLVGKELQKLFTDEDHEVVLFDRNTQMSFEKIDLAFFCVPSEIAKQLIPKAVKQNTICIDSSTAFRNDPNVPLVIPEINSDALNDHQGIIASPNCTTTLMLMPLALIHKKYQIKRIITTTFQAVSGAGKQKLYNWEAASKSYLNQEPLKTEGFLPFNVFLHESNELPNGYTTEEEKMSTETKKILGDPNLDVSATCVRVPVFRVHSLSVNVECSHSVSVKEIQDLVEKAPGVSYMTNPNSLDAEKKNLVLCGRIRLDRTRKNTFELWITGDQLLKGAALNMKQIADRLCQYSMI